MFWSPYSSVLFLCWTWWPAIMAGRTNRMGISVVTLHPTSLSTLQISQWKSRFCSISLSHYLCLIIIRGKCHTFYKLLFWQRGFPRCGNFSEYSGSAGNYSNYKVCYHVSCLDDKRWISESGFLLTSCFKINFKVVTSIIANFSRSFGHD